jgi:hypothetical protein
MMGSNLDISEFFVNGYSSTIDTKIYSLIDVELDVLNWPIDEHKIRSPEYADLSNAHHYIAEKYIKPIAKKYEIGYNSIWEGVETAVGWHNDLIENENNVFFMYYLTDIKNNGELCFRMNGVETGKIQPKKYVLVMGSQELNVQHKVIPTDEIRIACNFGFKVKWT